MDMLEFWVKREDRRKRRKLRKAREEMAAAGKQLFDVVCRFWLVGTCRMEERCIFLHKYIPSKIPLCVFIDVGCPNAAPGGGCEFRHYYNDGERPLRPVADVYRTLQSQVVVDSEKGKKSLMQKQP